MIKYVNVVMVVVINMFMKIFMKVVYYGFCFFVIGWSFFCGNSSVERVWFFDDVKFLLVEFKVLIILLGLMFVCEF